MGTTAINLSQEVPGKNIKKYLFDTGRLEKIPNGFSVDNSFFSRQKLSDLNMKYILFFFFLFSASKMINIRLLPKVIPSTLNIDLILCHTIDCVCRKC